MAVQAQVGKEFTDTEYFSKECLLRAESRDNEGPVSTAADLLTGQGEMMLFMGCEVKGAQSCPTL